MNQTVRPPSVPTAAAALEADARKLGYVPGFPAGLSKLARHADLSAYRRAKCPACAARMAARPFHRPRTPGGYKLILTCAVCGAGEAA